MDWERKRHSERRGEKKEKFTGEIGEISRTMESKKVMRMAGQTGKRLKRGRWSARI